MPSDQLRLFHSGPVEKHGAGILLTGPDLWLDASASRHRAFISHAHSDHICSHRHTLLTAPTRRFLDLRLGKHRTEAVELDYNKKHHVGESAVTLFPAGHILGSAQILVEDAQRIVYTGDFRLKPNVAAEKVQVKQCDILIMEATFGRPEYVFPGIKETVQMLRDEIERARHQDAKPVIRAYALGKAQEVIAIINRLGYSVATDAVTKSYCDVYEEFGVRLGRVKVLEEDENSADADVLVIGNGTLFKRLKERPFRKWTMFVSGWGIDPSTKYRYGVDVMIPLSDHADYFDLIAYVEKVEPKEVLVTHGAPEFAQHLKKLGFRARYLH